MSANPMAAIQRQIMWNRLIAVVEEQAQTLMRTAFSPIVRECGDLSAGVYTAVSVASAVRRIQDHRFDRRIDGVCRCRA